MMIPNVFFGALYECLRSPLRGVLTLREKTARAKEGGGGKERDRDVRAERQADRAALDRYLQVKSTQGRTPIVM